MDTNKKTLKDAFFPVEIKYLFMKMDRILSETPEKRLDNFRAIVATDSDHVFAVVAPGYRLVPNAEARVLGCICFQTVFQVTSADDMELFNVIMPKTRSFCHMDFIHKSRSFDFTSSDVWLPYIRITNSYNRMYALNFDVGFCRSICRNGIIFGKKNIEFKFYHNQHAFDPEAEFHLRAGDLQNLETAFLESLHNLKRYHVPPKFMWALACKVFSLSSHNSPKSMI